MTPPSTIPLNTLALKLKSLHKPGNPVILTNVHDAHSANLIASSPSCHALATASWSIAATQGIDDDDMTLPQNLSGIRNVIAGLTNAGKRDTVPLTCDLQDGYDDIRDTIRQVIALGAVGANIEDVDCKKRTLRSLPEATARVKAALEAAGEAGVPGFVINARTDVLGYKGTWTDVAERGRAFLDAGATSLFVWGVRGAQEVTVEDVAKLCKELGGMVAVQGPGPTKMDWEGLRAAGVCRVSFGPWVFRRSMEVFGSESRAFLES